MKKKFRVLSVSLLMLLLSSLFIGCNGSTEVDENTLVIWGNLIDSEIEEFQKIADEWSEKSGKKVVIYSTTSTGADYLKTADVKKPDIFLGVTSEDTDKLVKGRSVEEVPEDLVDKNNYVSEDLIQATSINGVQYGVPITADSVVLFYNKDIVKEVPKTMEDLIKDAKDKGIQFQTTDYFFSYGMILSQGGYIYNYKNNNFDYTDIGTDSEESIKGFTYLQDMFIKDDLFLPGISDIQAANNFQAGNIGYYIGQSGRVRTFKNFDVNFDIAKIPDIDGKEYKTFKYVKMATVSSKSNKKEEAWDLLSEFLKKSDEIFMETGPYAPTFKSNLESKTYKNSPYASVLLDQNNSGVILPNIVERDAFAFVIGGYLERLVKGEITPEECGKGMKKDLKDTIEDVIH